jgi:hypothetical protein
MLLSFRLGTSWMVLAPAGAVTVTVRGALDPQATQA